MSMQRVIDNSTSMAGLRLVAAACCVLVICSCRSPEVAYAPVGTPALPHQVLGPQMLCPPQMAGPGSGPALPWPRDEYLADGGDMAQQVTITPDWEVRGLNLEDTVAHFDTLDGRTLVQPSNRVHIYSPRFGSVRKVVGLQEHERLLGSQGMIARETLISSNESMPVETSIQGVQAHREIGRDLANVVQTRLGDGVLSQRVGPGSFHNSYEAYENFAIIRTGTFEMAEMPFLASSVDAAITWSGDQAVQIVLDHQKASETVLDQSVESIFSVGEELGCPKLRIVKVASKELAEPGDAVDFTLRFDNVGNEVIGNVVVIDNLTPRLEYVPNSSECSIDAAFFAKANQGDSHVLRWEITDPIEPGQGGVIRFQCRVR